jgi:hypothetical protein
MSGYGIIISGAGNLSYNKSVLLLHKSYDASLS